MSKLSIHLVSGGTCRTAREVVRASLAQFAQKDVQIVSHARVRTQAAVSEIIAEVAGTRGILCHSLVEPGIHEWITQECVSHGVPCVDVLGATLTAIGEGLMQTALGQPGLLYELHKEQFDRLDAVDFTMEHDDGKRLHDLEHADVVITGVSRVSKSVTCFYLACRGVRAANVPLIPGQAAPKELVAFDPQRVFGLTVNAAHLVAIRKARLDRLTTREVEKYANVRELNRELHAAESLMSSHAWRKIDVSYMATEEVASQILDTLRKLEH